MHMLQPVWSERNERIRSFPHQVVGSHRIVDQHRVWIRTGAVGSAPGLRSLSLLLEEGHKLPRGDVERRTSVQKGRRAIRSEQSAGIRGLAM
jgi:hypothetical protein